MSARKLLSEFQKRTRKVFSSGGTPVQPVSFPPGAGSSEASAPGPPIMWSCLKSFLRILDKSSNVFGPLKATMGELIQFVELHESALVARGNYETLKSDLEGLFSDLSTHFSGNEPPTMTTSIGNFCDAIGKELDRIAGKEEKKMGRWHLGVNQDLDEVMECYRRIHGHLKRLTLNADLSIWRIVDDQATEARLTKLTPSMSACYNSAEAALVRRRECTPKTRKQVLSDLSDWRHNKKHGNMYWLNGMAGTGKTTIANSLCGMLDRSHELGASFFCTRLLPECRNVKLILPTIAYQLARFSRPFRCALSQVLERDPDVHTRALLTQLKDMIVDPLLEVAPTLPTDLVVVIDALDECDDNDGVGQILEMLAKHAPDLPIKVFVSSRPEPQIRQRIGDTEAQLILHELDRSIVKEDIETYLRAELAPMSLSESELAALVDDAGVLFIYAATVVRYIGAGGFRLNPRKRLAVVLGAAASPSKNKDLNDLYGTVLDSAFNDPELEPSDRDQMKLVLDTVICAQEPLTAVALARLLQLGDEGVHAALGPLSAVLHVSGSNSLVTTLHASFPDYMLDPTRSKTHNCRMGTHHGRLAQLCFERIENNELQFNICRLESSYMLDEQVLDLEERAKKAIPLDLAYACQYWAVHLELGGNLSKYVPLLSKFLSMRLLLWAEVLNLKQRMYIGKVLLEKARGWSITVGCPQDLKELIHDAWRFTTMFATNPVSRSTPHIYVSMLASWPTSRPLARHYLYRTNRLAHIEGIALRRRQLGLLSAHNAGGSNSSVAFTPDGIRIASSCDNNAICVRDAQTGQVVLGPLEGHTVCSVTFSFDGRRIASGSFEGTICVWDALSGQMVLEPLKGHTSPVHSVSWSSDSRCIVSASGTNIICVWDTQTGQMMLEPFEGDPSQVFSIACSPDGTRFASGSAGNTVQVWDTQSRQVVLGPLSGHATAFTSVSFSPDGMHIAAGGITGTICVWDARSGQMLLGPLSRHTASIMSITFSPDNKRFASGSWDNTICVWDAQSGELTLGPLQGHACIRSIVFSADCMRIASTSDDKTVLVWDVQSRQTMPESLEGHFSPITSVAFSPDGTRIVSGSTDASIFVWDTRSGQMVLGPLLGHSEQILSATFSPDGTHILSSADGKTICLWDAHSGQVLLEPLDEYDESIPTVAFSPDGGRLASGYEDTTIHVWDTQQRQMVLGPLSGHTNTVMSVAFSPDGMRLVSCSADQTICIWDSQSGEMVLGPLKDHTGPVYSVAFSPDGKRIVSGSNNAICVWDSQTGKTVLGPLEGHTSWVSSIAFSPDGMHIVSGSQDNTICMWDARTGQLMLGPLEAHVGPVESVVFSPDNTHVVSCSSDKVIRVWRIKDEQTILDAVHSSSHSSLPSTSTKPIADPIATASSSWSRDSNGWVRDQQGRLLIWVPPDLRACLLAPQNTILISTQGSIRLHFENANIGELWAECYTPA